jgi:hypothetical protein
METQYYILMSLKTPQGFTNYGKYFLGDDREAAYSLFDDLRGDKDIRDRAVLHIDLMETINDLPLKIKTICCTLDQLGENCKLIARAIFRLKNIKEMV